jgi:hypothetical protein
VYTLGEEMIELASKGKYGKFQQKLFALKEDQVWRTHSCTCTSDCDACF